MVFLQSLHISCFLECTMYQSIFGIHDRCFGVFACLSLNAVNLSVAHLKDTFAVGELSHQLIGLLIHLQQFDG